MILEEAINKLIRDSINLILDIDGYAIAAKQLDAPRPIGNYADVDMISDVNIGWEQRSLADQTGEGELDINETISGLRETMMSASFYRVSAVDNCRKVHIALLRESIQELFATAGVGLITRSAVRETTEALENGWEERAQFDITLSSVGTDEDIIRSIQSLNIAGKFETPNNVNNFNIEVP